MYKQGCYEGYYYKDGGCLPCHGSCKTCSGPYDCDTCQDYMFLDQEKIHLDDYHPEGVEGKLCQKCPDGDYYDRTGGICRSCDGKCDLECAYQATCFQCNEGEVYDFIAKKCTMISDCISPKHLLSSSQFSLKTICRTLDYYVDPFSSKSIELGTEDFPYRSFTTLSSELVNLYSNSDYNISIYSNDAYIEHGGFVIINMTSITIAPIPRYQPFQHTRLVKKSENRPLLIPTNFKQHGITDRALFHVLKHADAQIDKVLTEGGFTTSETDAFSSRVATMRLLRTSIEIDGIDFYREEIDYNQQSLLIRPIYFQNRLLKITNCNFNVTGSGIYTNDPYNVHLENIVIEGYSLGWFMSDYPIICNYPEAYLFASLYAKNISFVLYKDKTKMDSLEFIKSTGHINVTIQDIDIGKFYGVSQDEVSAMSTLLTAYCIPDDDSIQTVNYNGFKSRIDNFNDPIQKFILIVFISIRPHYRPIIYKINDFQYFNYKSTMKPPLFAAFSTPIDEFHLSNLLVQNSTFVDKLIEFYNIRAVSLTNLTFSHIPSCQRLLLIINCLNVTINDVIVQDYMTPKFRVFNDVSITALPSTVISIKGLLLQSCSILALPFVEVIGQPLRLSISSCMYEDISMSENSPLFRLRSVSSFQMTNQSLHSVMAAQGSESRNYFVEAEVVTFGAEEVLMDKIVMENADISLIKWGTIKSEAEHKGFKASNIAIRDTHFKGPRAIISTDGFEAFEDIQVVFSSLIVTNVSFVSYGRIMEFNHRLEDSVVVKDSIFQDISSASIYIESNAETDSRVKTKLKIQNCTFGNIQNTIKPLVEVITNGNVEVISSNFSEITSIGERFGIINLKDSSVGLFVQCIFAANSAMTSSIFIVESKSTLDCFHCEIHSNFALKYGAFEVTSGSKISFKNSSLYNNFAIQNPVGSILETVEASEFTNCSIYDNSYLTNEEVIEEIQAGCDKLCMISHQLKQHLNQNIDVVINTEKSKYAISVITGSIEISQGTQIHTQAYLMNCFLSAAKISEVFIYSIVFSNFHIVATSSNLTIEHSALSSFDSTEIGSILGVSQSILHVENLTYSKSNSMLLLASSAEVYADNLEFNEIIGPNTLIDIYRSPRSHLSKIHVQKSSILENKMFKIVKSNQLKISNMSVSNYNKTLFEIKDSNVELIEYLSVSYYYRAIELISSKVELIAHSSFEYCGNEELIYGGGVLVHNSNATLLNTTFTQNKAVSGAAVASLCSDATNCGVEILNSVFQSNSATERGGAIYYNYKPPSVDKETVFINNTAQYGNDFASYPVMIGLSDSNSFDNIVIDQVSSGIKISQQLSLAIYDGNNQVMVLDDSSQINIVAGSMNTSMKGYNVERTVKGVTEFSKLVPVAEPGTSNVKYKISSKSINKNKVKNAFNDSVVQPEIIINFSYCKPGEKIIDGQCYECPAGTYSFNWNSTQCHQCGDNASCLGKQQMEVAKGYWRRSTNSTMIVECIRKEACDGGYHPENEYPTQCTTGYAGKLCSKCEISDGTKYQEVDDFECQVCPDPIMNAIRVIGLIIIMFIFMMVTIVSNVMKTTESEFSILLRILTNYLQIITTSMSMTTKYPSSLTDIFLPLNRIGDSSRPFLSFDCFITDYEIKGPFESNAILKLFLMLFLPLALFCVVALIWALIVMMNRHWVKDPKRNLIVSLTSIMFILHPKLTEAGINAFQCVTADKTLRFVRIDTDIECYSLTHIKWLLLLAFPILVIWVVGIPALGLLILYKAHKSDSNKMIGYFLILHQGLNDKEFYWEFVNTLRKILIVISFLFPNNFKIGLSLIVMVASERLERRFRPYKDDANNNLALLSTVAGIVTLNASYVFEQDVNIDSLDSIILVIIIWINMKFCLEWFCLCLKCFQSKNKLTKYAYLITAKLLCKQISDKETSENDKVVPKQENLPQTSKPKNVKKRYRIKKKRVKGRTKHKRIFHQPKNMFEQAHQLNIDQRVKIRIYRGMILSKCLMTPHLE
ncbi:unnamed protein product [Moneuplotes crassus]|uniref:Uncharacterized protein n=1 Tax=Euplotes crassus TaxID=5936 RepID=A0AAD1XR78_EUPCR|nr:unnamed protein product [Moneuplotes crassus]